MTVTTTQYSMFDDACKYFNEKLFNGELTDVLITLQRKSKSYGYYCAERFSERNGKQSVAEIAMNPDGFYERTDIEILSTLAHELAHHWQFLFGDAPKRAYHNREWAEKMKEIGLYPSTTGEPDGKETGARCSHYIIKGGKFEIVCGAFLLNGKKKLEWETIPVTKEEKEKKKTREKFVCPDCMQSVQAKKTANIMCGDCKKTMVIEEE